MKRSIRLLRLLPLALLGVGSATRADIVYKCVDAGGKVTYSQNPCYGENWHRFGAPAPAEPKSDSGRKKPPNDDPPAAPTKPATKKSAPSP